MSIREWVALAFVYVVGAIGWAVLGWSDNLFWAETPEDRRRALRMLWLTPVWPIPLATLIPGWIHRAWRHASGLWREAWPTKPKTPTVTVSNGQMLLTYNGTLTVNEAREMKDRWLATYHPEPDVEPESHTPGRWEQPK